jgi:outer membrane beta-barrel protein
MNRTSSVRDVPVSAAAARWLVAGVGAVALLAASTGIAEAQRRRDPLENEPAVRHRLLLVKNRFELTPLFESTINADFRHILGAGLKLEYHLSDMLSFGVIGVYGFGLDTGLVDKIDGTLEEIDPSLPGSGCMATPQNPNACDPTREPSRDEFKAHLNEMPIHGAAFVSLTPWYGKLAAFSTAFVNFDFYFQAGVSFAQLKSDCPDTICTDEQPGVSIPDPDGDGPGMGLIPDNNPNNDDPLNDGNKFGLYLGGGIHVFFNDFIALDLTVRDYAFSDNPSGADFNADLAVTEDDSRFLHHLFFGAGLSIMLPPGAKRTR